jgi:hypothetical protein
MLAKAFRDNLVCGLLEQFRLGGILTLQYVDDTLFSSRPIRNLKVILCLFEMVSGVRINFHKSEIIPLNLDLEASHAVAHELSCPLGPCLSII